MDTAQTVKRIQRDIILAADEAHINRLVKEAEQFNQEGLLTDKDLETVKGQAAYEVKHFYSINNGENNGNTN